MLRDRSRPLKSIADLKRDVLLHFDDPERSAPWLSWNVWLEIAGVPNLRPASALRFNHYDQVISAAIGGQGVAIGRRPLLKNFLADGTLVAPFAVGSVTDRAYFIVRTAATAGRREVDDFVDWLIVEGAAVAGREPAVPSAKRRQRASRKK